MKRNENTGASQESLSIDLSISIDSSMNKETQLRSKIINEMKEQEFYKQYVQIIKQIMFKLDSLSDIFYLSEVTDGYVLNMDIMDITYTDYLRIVNLQELYGSRNENIKTLVQLIDNLIMKEFEKNKLDKAQEAVVEANAAFKRIIDDVKENIANKFNVKSEEDLDDNILWDIIKETEECKYNIEIIEIEIDKSIFSEEIETLIANDQSNGNKSSEKNFNHVSNRQGNNNSILKHSNTEDNHQKQKENSSKDSSQNNSDQSNSSVKNSNHNDYDSMEDNGQSQEKSNSKDSNQSSSSVNSSNHNNSSSMEYNSQNQEKSGSKHSSQSNSSQSKSNIERSKHNNSGSEKDNNQNQEESGSKDSNQSSSSVNSSNQNNSGSMEDNNQNQEESGSKNLSQHNSSQSKSNIERSKHNNSSSEKNNNQNQEESGSKNLSQHKNDSIHLSQKLDESNNYLNSGLGQKQNKLELNILSGIISEPNNSRKRNRQVVSHIGNDVHRISHQLSTMHSTTDSDIPKCNDGSENETNYSSNSMTDIEKPTNFDYEAAYNELKLYDYSIEQTAPELKNNLPLNISIKQKARLFFWMLFHHPSVLIKSWFSNSGYSLQKHALLFEFRNYYNKQSVIRDKSSGVNKKTSVFDRTRMLSPETNCQLSDNLECQKKVQQNNIKMEITKQDANGL